MLSIPVSESSGGAGRSSSKLFMLDESDSHIVGCNEGGVLELETGVPGLLSFPSLN